MTTLRYVGLVLLLAFLAVCGTRWWQEGTAADVGGYYARGLEAYQAGDFSTAIANLDQAYAIESDDVGVNTLLGWSHWRLTNVRQARFYFERAYARDQASEDAKMGLAFSSLAEGDVATALPLLEELSHQGAGDRDVLVSLAVAYIRGGENRKAAGVYRTLLRRDPGDAVARGEFLALYGYPAYTDDLPSDPGTQPRPAAFQQWFRTRGDYLQALDGSEWKDVYLVGVNLGPARPGEFPSTVSREFAVYAAWLREIAAMNANTVRTYTILPPAFYQALKSHNEQSATPLWLIQEVWVHDDAQDLYDPAIEHQFAADLRNVIDLLHGQASVPYRPGAHHGIYTADVSRWVIGLAVGREIEPHLAQRTNAQHAKQTSHEGRYVSLKSGNPTEAWFARMCDLAVAYEMAKYNTQRPVTAVSWPPLDSLTHPSESPELEELRRQEARGEPISVDQMKLPEFWNDADVVTVDLMRLRAEAEFPAGLFALYHVYQHWPDFLFREPAFAEARDAKGPNRYLGYLQALKQAHRGIPLVIGEYGLSTSVGVAHLHPDGWHNGGFTESGQAAQLLRFTSNHWDTRCAGSIVFAWKDEWWKKVADSFTADFEIPRERDPLWWNVLDPEEAFGLVGYAPATPVPLLRGRDDDWAAATLVYEEPADAGELRAVRATADYAYLYLRLDVLPGAIDWQRRHYWLVLNTLPGRSGARTLPRIPVRLEGAANFIVQLLGPDRARLLIADNYNPNHRVDILPGESRIRRKLAFTVEPAEIAAFEEIVTEANRPRFARDGTRSPALERSRSVLEHGVADRSDPAFSDHSLWHHDATAGMIELRIPWGLLLVTDPSSRQVFAGTDKEGVPAATETAGVSLAVMVLSAADGADRQVLAALPSVTGGGLASAPTVYAWPTWDQVEYRQYFKRSYAALAPLFERLGRGPRQAR